MTRESPVRHVRPCAQPAGSGRGASVELELWEAPGRRGSRRGWAGPNPGALQAGRGTARTQGEGFDSARHAPSGAGGQSVRPGGAAPGTRGERRASGWAGGAGPPVPTAARSQAAGRQPGWTPAAACPPPWDRQGSAARSRVTRPMFARYAQTTFAYSAVKPVRGLGASRRCCGLVPTRGQRGLFVCFGENQRPGTSGCRLREATCVSSGRRRLHGALFSGHSSSLQVSCTLPPRPSEQLCTPSLRCRRSRCRGVTKGLSVLQVFCPFTASGISCGTSTCTATAWTASTTCSSAWWACTSWPASFWRRTERTIPSVGCQVGTVGAFRNSSCSDLISFHWLAFVCLELRNFLLHI